MSGKAIARSQFDRAADLINLEAYMRSILTAPFREVQVELPVRMDEGRIEVFTGYRIQHNGTSVHWKGSVSYHPKEYKYEEQDITTSIIWMTALRAIPFVGGKVGYSFYPR